MLLMKNENRLVQDHLGLVISIAKSFQPNSNDLEDYIQVGSIGLLKAIRNFNDKLDTSLSSFAWVCISREIINYIHRHTNSVQSINVEPTYITKRHLLFDIIPDTLTTTEKQVVGLRLMGYTFKEIGQKLGFSSVWSNKLYQITLQKIIKANESKKENINF